MAGEITHRIRKIEAFSIFREFIKNLYKDRHMITTMAMRELKVRYIGSLFGIFWAVINPLAQVAIYGIVFGMFLKLKPDPVYGTDSFLLYLLCGLIPWQFFSQATTSSTNVIISNRNLIMKAVGFPSEVLPIITIISYIFSHLIALVLLLIVLILFNVSLTPYILLVFLYLFLMIVFTIGISWIYASINVYMRDMQQVIGVVMIGWFFFTPIFYSASRIPPKLVPLLRLNPMYDVVEGYRYMFLAGKFPPIENLVYLFLVSFITFGVGGLIFRRLKPGFAEVL